MNNISDRINEKYEADYAEYQEFPRRSPRSQKVKTESDSNETPNQKTKTCVTSAATAERWPQKEKKKRGRKSKSVQVPSGVNPIDLPGIDDRVVDVVSLNSLNKIASATPKNVIWVKPLKRLKAAKSPLPDRSLAVNPQLEEDNKPDVKNFEFKDEELEDLFKPEKVLHLLNRKEEDDQIIGKEEDINEDDDPSDSPDQTQPSPIDDSEPEPIIFDAEKSMRLQYEYDLYVQIKWFNLDVLRDHLIETDWLLTQCKHPNHDFIYESKERRDAIISWLVMALRKGGATSVLDRKSWDNIEFLPGGPLTCSREVLENPRKARKLKAKKISHLKMAVKAVIPLLYWNVYQTKRDIFYQHFKNLNIAQKDSDELLDDVACGVRVPRPSIHVLSSSKGMIQGNVTIYVHKGEHDIPEGTSIERILSEWGNAGHNDLREIKCHGGEHIPNKVCKIVDIQSDAKFLLVIEKEATFQTLHETANFAEEWNCILLTGKGYPDTNTRHLVRLIWSFLKIPIFGLVDGDPHGFDIYCQYKYGSVSQAYDSVNLTTPQMKLIGLRPSDFDTCPFNEHSFRSLSQMDLNKVRELQQRPYSEHDEDLCLELNLFMKYRRKLELQALSAIAYQYLFKEFLPQRLVAGRYVHHDLLNRDIG